jgi:hypothetical protein
MVLYRPRVKQGGKAHRSAWPGISTPVSCYVPGLEEGEEVSSPTRPSMATCSAWAWSRSSRDGSGALADPPLTRDPDDDFVITWLVRTTQT